MLGSDVCILSDTIQLGGATVQVRRTIQDDQENGERVGSLQGSDTMMTQIDITEDAVYQVQAEAPEYPVFCEENTITVSLADLQIKMSYEQFENMLKALLKVWNGESQKSLKLPKVGCSDASSPAV